MNAMWQVDSFPPLAVVHYTYLMHNTQVMYFAYFGVSLQVQPVIEETKDEQRQP